MLNRRLSLALTLLAIVLGLGAVYRLQVRMDSEISRVHQERDDLIFRSGRLVKTLGLEYDGLLADIYWTRTVQYYGEKHRAFDPNYELLWPLLDVTTNLDPQLIVAYRFGVIFLSQHPPYGAGRPDLAEALIRRGIQNNPGYWRFWADLGFFYYWEMKDYQKASQAFLEGSKNPDAAIWMKVLAARVAQEGRSLEVSLFLWQQVYDSTTDPAVRKNAVEHLESLKAELDLRQLDEIVAQFHFKFSRYPNSMAEMISAGLLPGRPMDPKGFPYVLEPQGRVRLNPGSPIQLESPKPMLNP
jgi:hypothetical protein